MVVFPARPGRSEGNKKSTFVVAAGALSRISPDGVWRFSVKNAVKPAAYWTLLDVSRASIGAQKRTRTSTPLRAPAPEAGASTNSAIWARGRPRALGERARRLSTLDQRQLRQLADQRRRHRGDRRRCRRRDRPARRRLRDSASPDARAWAAPGRGPARGSRWIATRPPSASPKPRIGERATSWCLMIQNSEPCPAISSCRLGR